MASSSSSSKRKREIENAFHGIAPAPTSPPPTSDDPCYHRYDVFINHRGPDVKKTLASVIYRFLQCLGLKVFLDSTELLVGDSLPVTIQQAIRSSQVQIAIFSQRYAESPWCLAELELMLKTGAKIVPLFYEIKAFELRHPEKGVYADAFVQHRAKMRYIDKLEQWKQALQDASFIKGLEFDPSNGIWGDPCENIVKIVFDAIKEARNKLKLEVTEHPVGLEDTIQELDAKLSTIGENKNGNGRILAIVGTSGVGKTTLAKEFYNCKRSIFSRSSILFDVGEAHRNKKMGKMRQKLMYDLSLPLSLSSASFQPGKSKEGLGVERIRSELELWYSKPLIILDGVDGADQLDALAVNEFLNHGALVLVTCRDASVLLSLNDEMVKIYEMRGLDPKYGRQLFCWHAFRRSHPPNGREKLVETMLKVSGGLPLYLKDMGQEIYSMQNDIDSEV